MRSISCCIFALQIWSCQSYVKQFEELQVLANGVMRRHHQEESTTVETTTAAATTAAPTTAAATTAAVVPFTPAASTVSPSTPTSTTVTSTTTTVTQTTTTLTITTTTLTNTTTTFTNTTQPPVPVAAAQPKVVAAAGPTGDDNKTKPKKQDEPIEAAASKSTDGALASILIGVGVTLVFFLGLYCALQMGRRRSQQQEPLMDPQPARPTVRS